MPVKKASQPASQPEPAPEPDLELEAEVILYPPLELDVVLRYLDLYRGRGWATVEAGADAAGEIDGSIRLALRGPR